MTDQPLYADDVIKQYAFRVAPRTMLPDFDAGPGDLIPIRNVPVPDEFVAHTTAEFELLVLAGTARAVGDEQRFREQLRNEGNPLAEAELPGPLPWMSRMEAEAFEEMGDGEIVELSATS
jgi:hypothetical protein